MKELGKLWTIEGLSKGRPEAFEFFNLSENKLNHGVANVEEVSNAQLSFAVEIKFA